MPKQTNIIKIVVPAAGESVQEAMISAWLVDDGEFVEKDTAVVELETDKASMELVAEAKGVIKIIINEGIVKVGDHIGSIELTNTSNINKNKAASKPSPPQTSNNNDITQQTPKPPAITDHSHPLINQDIHGPVVKKLLADQDLTLDIWKKPGSGKNHRLTKADVLSRINKLSKKSSQSPQPKPSLASPIHSDNSLQRSTSKTPMSLIRRKIASRLLSVKQNTAMLTTFNEVDMTTIIDLRKKIQTKTPR